jgi:hypothetical protein
MVKVVNLFLPGMIRVNGFSKKSVHISKKSEKTVA